jgi:hypothetical protein
VVSLFGDFGKLLPASIDRNGFVDMLLELAREVVL